MNWIIYLPAEQNVIGPFQSEATAYVWIDRERGELNADQFHIWVCIDPTDERITGMMEG